MEIYKKAKYCSAVIWILGFFLLWELVALLLDKGLQDPMAYKKLPYFHQVILEFGHYGSNLVTQAHGSQWDIEKSFDAVRAGVADDPDPGTGAGGVRSGKGYRSVACRDRGLHDVFPVDHQHDAGNVGHRSGQPGAAAAVCGE